MRTRVLAGVAVVAVVATVVVIVGVLAGRSPGGQATTSSYRIVYSSEEPTAGTQRTVVVEVDRPYRARSRVFDGDVLVGGSIWTEFGVYVVDQDGTAALVQPVLPGRPGPDVRLEILLPEAVAAGVVEDLGPAEAAGIACTTYRSNGPLDAELPERALTGDRTVSCVDDLGRILRDEWRIDGQIVRRREATEVLTGVDLTDDELFGGPPPKAADLTLLELRAVSLPGDPVLAVVFPDGLFGMPRDLVVEARDVQPPGPAVPTRVSQRATYTDGSRVVTLTQSRALTGPEPPLPDGEPFELAPFDRAVIAPGFDGFTVTGMVGSVRVEIRGPFTTDEFAAVTIELAS